MTKKLLKRTMFLAVLALMFTMMFGMTVFAKEKITEASATITLPVVGQHPVFDPSTVVFGEPDKLFSKYDISMSTGFVSDLGGFGDSISADYTFLEDTNYNILVCFSLKDMNSYEFGTQEEMLNKIKINDMIATCWTHSPYSDGTIRYYITYKTPKTKCTITIDPNNGQSPSTIENVPIGPTNCSIALPDSYGFTTPEGYQFAGWKIGDVIYNASQSFDVTGDMTAVAQWTPITYSITYILNDGIVSGVNPIEYTVESNDITLINPAKNNFYFVGWTGTDLSEPTQEVTITKGSTGDRTYTAQWFETTKITKITLDSNYVAPVVGEEIPTLTTGVASVNDDTSLKDIIYINSIKWQKRTGEGQWDFVDATGTFEAGEKYRLRMLFYVADESQSLYAFPTTSVTVNMTGTELVNWQQNATSLGMWTDDVEPTSSASTTSISANPVSVDFGSVEAGFSSSDHIQVVTITNNGTNPIYLNHVNPTENGPFASYAYDTTAVINPGENIGVRLVANDSSPFANTAGSYEGNYVFTATNANDSSDKFTLTVPATVTIVVPATITEVSVSNVDLPEVGESWEDTTNSPSSMTYGGQYQMCGMGFYVQNGTEWVSYNTSTDIVEGGKTYKVTIDLTVTGTAKFDSSITDANITINGEAGKFAAFYNSNSIISIYQEFTTEAISTTTSISANPASVDFGSVEAGFSSSDHIQVVTITNNGTNPIYLNNVNPTDDGPFASYAYDTTAVINPGENIGVRLVANDSSPFANTAGSYEGNYVFTATNANDSSDKFTLTVPATVTIVVPATITEVSVSNVDLPEVGESWEDTTNSPSSMTYGGEYQMCGMGFYVQNGTEWVSYNSSTDIVEGGKTYKVTIELRATGTEKFDSSITDANITINGEAGKFAAFYNSNSIISIYKEFTTETITTNVIDNVTFVGGNDFIAGNEVGTWTIPSDVNYELSSSAQIFVKDFTDNKVLTATDKYIGGHSYALIFAGVMPKEGFEYGETTLVADGVTTAYTPDFDNVLGGSGRISFTVSEVTPITYAVKISATDIANGEEVEGATLQVIDNNGVVVTTWVSTVEAKEITGLSGEVEYTLKSTVSPDGYVVPTDITFIIDDEGKVTSTGTMTEEGILLVEFTKTQVKVLAVKESDNSALSNVTLQIVDGDGNVVEEWDSTNENHTIEGLITEIEYTLKVTVVPDGYEIPDDVSFSIESDGSCSSASAEGVILVLISSETIEPTEELVWTIKDGDVLSDADELYIGFWFELMPNDEIGPGLLKLVVNDEENSYELYTLEDKLLFALVEQDDETLFVKIAEGITSGDNITYEITDEDRTLMPDLATYKTSKLVFDVEETTPAQEKCTITFDANGGSGTMNSVEVDKGSSYTLPTCSFTAPSNKTFDKWNLGKKGAKITVDEDITIIAQWKAKSSGTTSGGGSSSSSLSYKVTTKIENGTITPANISVEKNENQEFTFKADEGYEITDVLVDGKSIGAVDKYTLEKVTEKHTIEVKTAKVEALSNVDDWAKEEMAKASEKGLIPETFVSIDASKAISRADFAAVAVKLYEALTGKNAEIASNNPFTDTSDEYVLKAYNLGITKGVSETEFGNGTITREQMATMINRALKSAGIETEVNLENVTKFADDDEMHDWGRPSIYAMAKEEIIKGVGDNKFNPLGIAKVEEALAISLRCEEVYKNQ